MSERSIWDKLRAKGFSEKATAAIMGNMQSESAFRSNNVEDRYHTESWKTDEYYTSIVDNGSYSKQEFKNDSFGYGLCQWTWPPRKEHLYDFAKSRGVSIADEQMQIDFLVEELKKDFKTVYDILMSDASLYAMTEKYMKVFENPADQSDRAVNGRVSNAQTIYNKYAGTPEPSPEPTPTPAPSYESCDITVRVLRRGDKGRDVFLMQCGLSDMGYSVGVPDGDFGPNTESGLNEFKSDCNLYADGVADQAVWQIIFQ